MTANSQARWLRAAAGCFACTLLLSIVVAAPAAATDCSTEPDGTVCNFDSDPCTVDTCSSGVCTPGPNAPDGTLCTADGNPCTVDSCSSGVCTPGPNAPDGTPCDADALFCTYDTCSSGVCTLGGARDCASNDQSAIDFESYTPGVIHGQDGWSSFGAAGSGCAVYDHAVDSSGGTTGFGAQSLRMSNAVTSGCFGDQTFSKSLPDEVGETDADNGGFSGGSRRTHFEAAWDIASTVPGAEQVGLRVDMSPDRGDGARMSLIRVLDLPGGLTVRFFDYQDVAPFGSGTPGPLNDGCSGSDDFISTDVVTGLDRSVPHNIRITMDVLEGPRNDVVKVYVDSILVHTGTSWEDYFRWCGESVPGNVSRTVDSILFRTGGPAKPALAGKGFLIDNLTLQSGLGSDACNAGACDEGADTCTVQPTNEGGACDTDGNGCTDDVCTSGTCTHPNNTAPCDDGIFCNGVDACSGGSCVHPGDPCTGGAECNTSCNEGAANCFNPAVDACSTDGNVCTDDHCNGAGMCVHTNNAAPCDNGLFCDGTDTCGGGACVHSGDPCVGGTECNTSCNEASDDCFNSTSTSCTADLNNCTDDHCNGAGACVHPPSSAGTPCNDGNLCTQTDQCNGSATCVGSNPVICTALDQCHVVGVCNTMTGMCSNPNKPDGQVCNDGNVCTQQDACQGGVCVGNMIGADTDGDGYCDFQETQAGCNPNDPKEIPPQGVTFGGLPSEHSVGANGLITYNAPGSTQRSTVSTGTDTSCATTGACGATNFCTTGTIADPCTTNTDCNQPLHNCRMVVNYGSVADLTLVKGLLGHTDVLADFMPATPGCSRKVDLTLDPALSKQRLKLRATGTLGGRVRRDNDRFTYGP